MVKPMNAVSHEALRALVKFATLAPSSHNTQPWLFQVEDHEIRLIADRTRALPVNDPDDRELTISCGCALMNLRIAAEDAGLAPTVRKLPDSGEDDLLAVVELEPAKEPSGDLAKLAPAIETRRTYRKNFANREVPQSAVDSLREAAQAEGVWLKVQTDESTREAVADLVETGDEAQWSDASWRRELAAWMHPRRKGDGLTVPGLIAPIARGAVRTFDLGSVVGDHDEDLAEDAPVLAVLGTEGDQAADWIAAGQALQRLLLTACGQGLQASYLNQPIQVASLRPKLQQAIGERRPPQLLLRIGYPDKQTSPSPRRDVDDVIVSS